MRPVNLIPPEERRGDRAPTRTGPVSYLLVGALALALAGVTSVVLTSNQIADREDEVAALEAKQAAATETAQRLAPYAEFAALEQARAQTVDTLAKSRFDWERVLRELALVIPADVQLTGVTGTVAPGITPEGSAAANALRDTATGPALELAGCAGDHEVVAELAAALEDIDGVTRVAVNRSERSETKLQPGATGLGAGCSESPGVSSFEMIATFDEVTVAAVPAATETAAPVSDDGAASDPSVAEAQATEQEARDSAEDQTEKARDAANLVPGVAR